MNNIQAVATENLNESELHSLACEVIERFREQLTVPYNVANVARERLAAATTGQPDAGELENAHSEDYDASVAYNDAWVDDVYPALEEAFEGSGLEIKCGGEIDGAIFCFGEYGDTQFAVSLLDLNSDYRNFDIQEVSSILCDTRAAITKAVEARDWGLEDEEEDED